MEQTLTQYFLLFTYYEFGRSKTYSTSCLVKIADGELINYIIKQYNYSRGCAKRNCKIQDGYKWSSFFNPQNIDFNSFVASDFRTPSLIITHLEGVVSRNHAKRKQRWDSFQEQQDLTSNLLLLSFYGIIHKVVGQGVKRIMSQEGQEGERYACVR